MNADKSLDEIIKAKSKKIGKGGFRSGGGARGGARGAQQTPKGVANNNKKKAGLKLQASRGGVTKQRAGKVLHVVRQSTFVRPPCHASWASSQPSQKAVRGGGAGRGRGGARRGAQRTGITRSIVVGRAAAARSTLARAALRGRQAARGALRRTGKPTLFQRQQQQLAPVLKYTRVCDVPCRPLQLRPLR